MPASHRLLPIALVVAACSGGSTTPPVTEPTDGSSPTPSASARPARTPVPTLDLPELIELAVPPALAIRAEPSPDFATIADGFLFVGGVGNGVAKYDDAGELLTSVSIPGETCAALDAGFGAAWTATCDGPGLARIDTATDAVTPIDLGGAIPDSEASVGVGEGGVWVVVRVATGRELVRVDPATNAVVARYPVGNFATAVRAGLGGIWVSEPDLDQVDRYDPATGDLVASIAVGDKPQFLAVGEGAVWTLDQLRGTVTRIDPATNTVAATIAFGEVVQGGDIAAGLGSVWVRGSQTLAFEIDVATNEIIGRYGPSSGSGAVVVGATAVWFTAHDTLTIWRVPVGR